MTAGHTYQRFYNISYNKDRDTSTGEYPPTDLYNTDWLYNGLPAIPFQLILESYFARANFTLDSKYIFTATYRRDISSRFSKDNRNNQRKITKHVTS